MHCEIRSPVIVGQAALHGGLQSLHPIATESVALFEYSVADPLENGRALYFAGLVFWVFLQMAYATHDTRTGT